MTQPHHFAAWVKDKQAEIAKKIAKLNKTVYAHALRYKPPYSLNFEIISDYLRVWIIDTGRDKCIFSEELYGLSRLIQDEDSETPESNMKNTERNITTYVKTLDKMLKEVQTYSRLK
jgi:hypothetical protein